MPTTTPAPTCDECSAPVGAWISRRHTVACSLHPANVVQAHQDPTKSLATQPYQSTPEARAIGAQVEREARQEAGPRYQVMGIGTDGLVVDTTDDRNPVLGRQPYHQAEAIAQIMNDQEQHGRTAKALREALARL